MSDSKIERKDWLHQRYVVEAATIEEIAAECDCSNWKVSDRLKKFNIERRSKGTPTNGDVDKLRDSNYLRTQYWDHNLTVDNIAKKIGCSTYTVLKHMDKHGIERRDRAQSLANGEIDKVDNVERLKKLYHDEALSISQIAQKFNLATSTVFRKILKHGIKTRDQPVSQSNQNILLLSNPEWLKTQYLKKEKSTYEIANELSLNDETIRRYMIQHNIQRRDKSEAVPSAENHPDWKPGQHDYYGPNWQEKSLKARIRDQARCQRCGVSDKKSKQEFGSVNFIHHIIPRSEFFDENGVFNYQEANKITNLITLCPSCHGRLEGLPVDNR